MKTSNLDFPFWLLLLLCALPAVAIAQVNSSTDKCSGKACSVKSLKVSAGGSVSIPADGALCFDGVANCGGAGTPGLGWYYAGGPFLRLAAAGADRITISNGTGAMTFTPSSALTFGGGVLANFSAGVQAATFFQSLGAATTTGAACTAGTSQYDTTGGCWKDCTSTAVWSGCRLTTTSTSMAVSKYWSGVCFGTCSNEDVSMTGAVQDVSGTNARVTCSWATVGTGGSTGVVVKVRNVTDSTDLCTCTLGACTTAVNVPLVCTCGGTYTTGKSYTMQITSGTDCTVNPGNIVCQTLVTGS